MTEAEQILHNARNACEASLITEEQKRDVYYIVARDLAEKEVFDERTA